jgi:hypothetical protein
MGQRVQRTFHETLNAPFCRVKTFHGDDTTIMVLVGGGGVLGVFGPTSALSLQCFSSYSIHFVPKLYKARQEAVVDLFSVLYSDMTGNS